MNIKLSDEDYEFITNLDKFDLIMLLSEINDHGWQVAKQTLTIMTEYKKQIIESEQNN